MSTPALAILQQPPRPGGPHRPTDPDLAYEQAAQAMPTVEALRRRSFIRLGVLGVLLVLILIPATTLPLAWIGALLLLAAVLGSSMWDRYLGRKLSEGLARAEELALLGRFPEAWDVAWETLPLCRKHPLGQEMWLRLTLVMGRAAMWGRAYETAETLVTLVSDQVGPDHPLAPFCHVQRSLAAAFDGRPGVAEDELVAVRGLLRRSPAPQAGAVLLTAELAQAYAAQQPERAVEHLEGREERLSALGRDAGIGHLLAAWAYQQTGDLPAARAAQRDAVLLMGRSACKSVLDLGLDDEATDGEAAAGGAEGSAGRPGEVDASSLRPPEPGEAGHG